MSMPKIPDMNPEISLDRCKTIELLLSSIALEEISLSHILNAEGEKLQSFLKKDNESLDDFIEINDSLNKTLRTVVKSQILLHFKLEDAVTLDKKACCEKKCDPCKETETDHSDCCKKQTRQSKECNC
ncbi:hypothetical protein [Virgibacillus natechei]|nr:hypothetical protein [Virgibacillus natechei]UZD12490.1 hypothetical protein OLD84_16525 [Virgibacillus natechei]